MHIPTEVFDDFATLFSYPSTGLDGALTRSCAFFAEDAATAAFPGVYAALQDFADGVRELPQGAREELYTRTFDINPVASLELGWHLYGEQYERGSFLVRMRGLLREAGIPEQTELPDHCAHVLQLLGRMEEEQRRAFIGSHVGKALRIMREQWTKEENPYRSCLDALRGVAQVLSPSSDEGVPHHV
ncbi:MAG: molecular chaperone TorD family protein [Bacteroidota bacterium]|nr:molecular chaperone TorD family protein [Bacteroidota bacterium]